jgi:DNA repair protein RadC
MKLIPKSKENKNYETPQERLIRFGPEVLANHELLAILLEKKFNKGSVLQLSSKLLMEFEGLDGILSASFEEIKSIDGMREAKATQILAIAELVRRLSTLRASKKEIKITCSSDLANVVMNEMNSLNQEVLKVIFLNTKNIIIGSKDVFKGSLNSSIVHPREIFKPAINKCSASIIICHNHPSGDPTPSQEDINITLRIKECGSILGIKLLDHIIIGNNKFVSLKDKRLI